METWPHNLPLPSRSYNFGSDAAIDRTEMTSGKARQRLLFPGEENKISVVWEFQDWQLAIFRAFVFRKLSNGNDYFMCPAFFGDGQQSVKLRVVNGKYTATHKTNSILFWTVAAVLEVEDSPIIDEELYEFVLNNNIDGFTSAVDALYNLLPMPSNPFYP